MHISKFIISTTLFLISLLIQAQDTIPVSKDSIKIPLKYGVRLGFDISRPISQLAQKQDLGFEITGDYRVAPNWYIAAEIGYSSEPSDEDYLVFDTKGSYAKIGFNYNAYENWQGMNNEVYLGLRYGISTFQQHLISYTTPDLTNYFGYQTYYPDQTFTGLTGHWLEGNLGMKVEVVNNLFLTTAVHFKRLITSKKPDNFDNLYIPGFNTVFSNKTGIGFNYTIAYLIPFYKK